jgi:hypothetical protein
LTSTLSTNTTFSVATAAPFSMRGAKRARFIDIAEPRTMASGTSVVGEVTLSTRPSRSTVKCNSTPLTTASAGSSWERSMELTDGR